MPPSSDSLSAFGTHRPFFLLFVTARVQRHAPGLALAALAVIALPSAAAAQAPESPARELAADAESLGLDHALSRIFVEGVDKDRPTWLAVEVEDEQEKPKTPPHTGIQALIRSTASDFKAFPLRKSTWVILAIGGAVAGGVSPLDDDINERARDSSASKFFAPGRVIGYAWVQAGAAVGTYVVGRWVIHPPEGQSNKITHIGFDLLRANILTQALTYGVKYAVRRDRPTGECCAFPSGHASVTFATASVLERHFGARAAWPTFLIGGYVAMSRVFDNRHWMSDVLFGSALGIASGWTVVGRHGRSDFAMLPVPTRGGMAVTFMWTPGASATPPDAQTAAGSSADAARPYFK